MKQSMKKLSLSLLLIAAPTTMCKRVNIDSTLLSFVDGTEYIGIKEIFDFAKNNVALLHGTHFKTAQQLGKVYNLEFPEPLEKYTDENGKVGLIWFKDHYTTMKALAEYEIDNPEDPELAIAIERTCNHFARFSEDYVEDIETAKDIMVQIIANWAHLHEKPDSLMLEWSEVESTKRDSLYKTMTTFKVFDTFLEDLLLFLKDLVQNCPKSHKQYRESLKNKNNAR